MPIQALAKSFSVKSYGIFREIKIAIFPKKSVVDAKKNFKPKMNFLPRILSGYFKSLGTDKVKICPSTLNNGAVSIWNSDPDFVGLAIGTAD